MDHFKKKIVIILLLIVFINLNIGLFQKANQIFQINCHENTELNPKSSSEVLFDSVELFKPYLDIKKISLNFTKNWVYYFSFKVYVPYSSELSLDVSLISPEGWHYNFFEFTTEINLNTSRSYFEYGAAESGIHNISIKVNTDSNVNIHIYIKEKQVIKDYYNNNVLDGIKNWSVYGSDILRFANDHLSETYEIFMLDDTEYCFNLFRTNMLNYQDVKTNNYENPIVNLQMDFDGDEFSLYPWLNTLNFSLQTNIDQVNDSIGEEDSGGYLINNPMRQPEFKITFGAHKSANVTLDLSFDHYSNDLMFNLNYAFLIYSVGDIGNGPDIENQSTAPNILDNLTQSEDNRTELFNLGEGQISRFEEYLLYVRSFISMQFDKIIIILLGGFITTIAFTKFKLGKKIKKNLQRKIREPSKSEVK